MSQIISGYTPLLAACQEGHEKVASLWIENGADVSTRDSNGSTSLHLACRSGHEKIPALLIERGADISQEIIMERQHFM